MYTVGYIAYIFDIFFVWSYVGQSQMVQLPNNPRGQAPTTSVDGLSNNSEYYARPYHKRSAVAPPSGAHWVQRQKMSHPTTTHHSMPIRFPTKPAASVTANLAHPSIPIYQSQSQTQQRVRALMNPFIPYTSNFRPRVPVTAAPSPTVSHITWKGTLSFLTLTISSYIYMTW